MSTTAVEKLSRNSVSPYSGGVGAVERVMRKSLGCALTLEQSQLLWQECSARLAACDDQETVDDIERYTDGVMDTWDREGLMSALAHVLTGGLDWPINASPDADSEKFAKALRECIKVRGYAAFDESDEVNA